MLSKIEGGMPDIPDISSMSPDRWLSKMQTVREDLLEEFEQIFGEAEVPSAACDAFEELFAEYTVQAETGESARLLDVDVSNEKLVFEHESGEQTVDVVYSEDDFWRAEGHDREKAPDDVAAHHRELGIEVLELIPWWAEGAFSRRAGRPSDFVD